MLEIKILTPQDNFLKAVEFNYDELKSQLQENLDKYQNLVFTEKNMDEGKNTRARLNKLKTALDDKRKEIKKRCLEPYEVFEVKIKELIGLVDKPTLAIDTQIKAYEEALRETKRQEIINYFNSKSMFGDLIKIDHPCFWDEKWLNTTKKMKDVELEIDNKITAIQEGLKTIDLAFNDNEFKPQIRDVFLKTLDINSAFNEKARLENQKKAEEEYKRKQEEIAKQKEQEVQRVEPVTFEEVKEEVKQEEVREWKTLLIDVNDKEFDEVKKFLKDNGINYKFSKE